MFPSCTGSGPADCNAVSGLIKLVVFGLLICWKIDKPRDFFFHFFFFLLFFFFVVLLKLLLSDFTYKLFFFLLAMTATLKFETTTDFGQR